MFSGLAPNKEAMVSRYENSIAEAPIEPECEPRPGLPANTFIASDTALETVVGFGYVVAALSRYINLFPAFQTREG